MSSLAFRTPQGGIPIHPGHSQTLGVVDVSPFSQIRVVTDERTGSSSDVTIKLIITEGDESVFALDQIHLAPHSGKTNVYSVPGTSLTVSAAIDGCGTAGIDVLIYGN